MTHKIPKLLAGLGLAALALAVHAAPVVSLASISTGTASFDKFASANGAGASVDKLTGMASLPDGTTQVNRTGYNIKSGDGSSELFGASLPGMSGDSFSIDPAVSPAGTIPTGPGSYRPSGLLFTFDSSINYFGVEVGDWGTCCFPSRLYMQLDDGPALLLGSVLSDRPTVPLDPNGQAYNFDSRLVFASVLDTGKSFNRVYIWGDGVQGNTAERLVAGGAVRFANVRVTPPNPTPLPGTLALLLAGLGLVAVVRRRAA